MHDCVCISGATEYIDSIEWKFQARLRQHNFIVMYYTAKKGFDFCTNYNCWHSS